MGVQHHKPAVQRGSNSFCYTQRHPQGEEQSGDSRTNFLCVPLSSWRRLRIRRTHWKLLWWTPAPLSFALQIISDRDTFDVAVDISDASLGHGQSDLRQKAPF